MSFSRIDLETLQVDVVDPSTGGHVDAILSGGEKSGRVSGALGQEDSCKREVEGCIAGEDRKIDASRVFHSCRGVPSVGHDVCATCSPWASLNVVLGYRDCVLDDTAPLKGQNS